MILAGDIGGTKTVLALFEGQSGSLRLVRDGTFPSRSHVTLDEILYQFLKEDAKGRLHAGCFGVAGAVIDGKSHTTNLPWELDENKLAAGLQAPHVKLLNDLEAAAYGMLFLGPDELCQLKPAKGAKRAGNVAVIAAGTGLGEAMLYWDGARHHPLASEGGHCDFAPRTDLEIDLLKYLRKEFHSHVSYERVLSGPGFFNIYRFLRDSGFGKEAPEVAAAIQAGEPNATIAQRGLDKIDPLCETTLDLFTSIYGAETGNLALKCVAVGGVYVGGGIAPKLLPALQSGAFIKGFTDKGRFSALLDSVEVNVALNPRAPLIGAANYAATMS